MTQPGGISRRELLVYPPLAATAKGAQAPAAGPLDRRPQPWRRMSKPVLSALTTTQNWCKVVLYSPHVIQAKQGFKIWYLGTSTHSRADDMALGYAESRDGISWTPHARNPVLTPDRVPWAVSLQTPCVLFDAGAGRYRMWFDGVIQGPQQALGYATSRDGIEWDVHPEPLYPSGRRPSVLIEGPNRYRMWMNSDSAEGAHDIAMKIYEFSSEDGIRWKRAAEPAIQPHGPLSSVIYPYALKNNGSYYMWYGGHSDGGRFQLHCAKSADGARWQVSDEPAFPAAESRSAFDGRYTSTPCVLPLPDSLVLYYSARDWNNEYVDGAGRRRGDASGVYAHIGRAVLDMA